MNFPRIGVIIGAWLAFLATSYELQAALATPEVREKLDVAGCEPKSAPLGAFADIIKSDIGVWARVVKEAGITVD
jgi:tripartite-type tricarboxylate transporter receptor subunit TctC